MSINSETIVFLPWLRLAQAIEISDLAFQPIGKQIGWGVLPPFMIEQAKLISSSYTDQAGHEIPDFTVVLKTAGEKPWALSSEEFGLAREAASILFFCAWSLNDYYSAIGNSSLFNIVGQRFTQSDPQGICLTLRRRDGETLSGGYRHGQVRIIAPPQYAINHQTHIDLALLSSLMSARDAGSKTYDLLLSVLGLLELANTDRDYMTLDSEIILLSSAFETFLEINASKKALEVGNSFASFFEAYSTLTAQDAINKGRTIYLSPSGADSSWSIFKTWAHEFYQLRNEFVHSKKTPHRTWGWHNLEHAVMGAFTFPLLLKLKLNQESLYELSDQDEKRCHALGNLLVTPDWGASEHRGSLQNTWRDILDDGSDRALRAFLEHHFKVSALN